MTHSTEEGPCGPLLGGARKGPWQPERQIVSPPMQPRDAAVTINSPSGDTSLPGHEIVEVKSPGDGSPTLP